MNQATIELTPEQLARLAVIESRVMALRSELSGFYDEIDALRQAGLETREAAEAIAGVDDDVLDELRMLRVSRGIPAFSDWWCDRVLGLRQIVDDVPDEDRSDDAEAWRHKYQAALSVERAILKADPELIGLLDRAADRPRGKIDAAKLEAAIGMKEEQLEDRAEAVLIQLIESGWRP